MFSAPGHHIGQFFADLERLHSPETVLHDYEAVHGFLHELTTYLEKSAAFFLDQVIDDPFPGYEVRQRRVTKILPGHAMMAIAKGIRYDDDLRVTW